MPLLDNIRKCVSRRHGLTRRPTRVLFNVRIEDSFKTQNVPSQLRDLLVYIAREGVAVTDLFRRPGNPQDMKKIISDLEAGRPITWSDYNFYTLANIAKRYLLHIEGGILGRSSEEKLISMLNLPDDQSRIEGMHSVLISQPKPVQQLLALLFGIWFRMIYHTEVNAMSVEAVAKSVAGSLFPSCTTSPQKVERASKVMEYLITGFASADLFSRELIEYFTSETRTSISRVEKFKYEFRFPKDVPREKSIRLFMRLLLEEGKKHGFHLIHDAVSKELFENTDWETVCLPHVRSKQLGLTQSATSTSVKQDVPDPSASLTHILPTICGDSHGKRRNTESDTNSVPGTLERLSFYRPAPLGHLTDKPMGDPVQQLSEKRTCVTTTPRQCHPLDTPDANDISRDSSFKGLDAVNSQKQQQQTVPGFRFRTLNSTNRTGDQQRLLQQPPHSTKALARPAAPTQACFNSVKRRQLERLQKRSDWFLSPPSGLRSSGLIHLNPTSSSVSSSPSNHESVTPVEGVVSTSTSCIGGVHRDASFTINVSLSSSGDCMPSAGVSTESGDSRHSELGPMVAWNDEDYVKNRAISRPHRLSDEDQDEIDHLVYTDPHRLWTNGSVACNRAAAESVKPLTSGKPYPTATSSPYGTCSPVNTHTPDKGNTNVGFPDEKENFPEVETRYYVVERYYGPEPRQPLLNRFGQYR